MEIWKDVVGYEGLYQVSNLGNVRSLDRYVNNKFGELSSVKGTLLKQSDIGTGHLKVRLYKDKVGKTQKVHRLVATAFIPNPDNKPTVDHINRVRDDNRLENLRWATYKEQTTNREYSNDDYSKRKHGGVPIVAINIDTGECLEFNSYAKAGRTLKISSSDISQYFKGNRKRVGRYTFRRSNDEFTN